MTNQSDARLRPLGLDVDGESLPPYGTQTAREPTLTVVQAAKRLNLQPAVVRRWIAEGKIAATKARRGHRIPEYEVTRVKEGG